MKPLISVCMPSYNHRNFIGEAIESVLSQTYTNFELIISDNASTDDSVEVIKSYNDSRIRLNHNDSNIMVYQNVNRCMMRSNGELIAVLHSDDKYEPDFFQEIVNAYEKYPDKSVFITGVNFWHSEENRTIPWQCYKTGGIKPKAEVMLRLAHINNIGNGVNVVFHKNCLATVGMFSNKYSYSADYDLWLRLAEKYDFVYIPKILAHYRIHNYNLSHLVNKNLSLFKEGIEIFQENISRSRIISKNTDEIFRMRYGNMIHRAMYMAKNYKSGQIARDMLDYTEKICPKFGNNLAMRLMYYISYLIKEKNNKIIQNNIFLLLKILLYPHRKYLDYSLEKLVKSFYEDSYAELKEVEDFAV